MVLGYEQQHTSERSIQTDRRCSNRCFCDFLEEDASKSGAAGGDIFICTGCNDMRHRYQFSLTDWVLVKRSRDEQMPTGWN